MQMNLTGFGENQKDIENKKLDWKWMLKNWYFHQTFYIQCFLGCHFVCISWSLQEDLLELP